MDGIKKLFGLVLSGGRTGAAFTAVQLVWIGVIVIAAGGIYAYFYHFSGATTQQRTYTDPRISGSWVDRCYHFGKDCDEPAASAWCRLQPEKWLRATESSWAYTSQLTDVTYILGDKRSCTGTCGRLVRIVCAK